MKQTLRQVLEFIRINYLTIVLIISAVGVAGSLYASDVLMLEACKACWYQRIFTYPLPILAVAAQLTKVKKAAYLMLPLTLIGMFIAALQVADTHLGTELLGLINCSSVACADANIQLLGIGIPTLSLLMFAVLNVILAIAIYKPNK